MSDGRVKIQEAMHEIVNQQKQKTLRNIGVQVLNTNPMSGQYDDIKWIFDNKEKILRNKKLIDLLG